MTAIAEHDLSVLHVYVEWAPLINLTDHMGTRWGQCGENMGTTGMWRPHGDNMETTWGQHEDNVETTWVPQGCGDHMGTTWRQWGDHGDVETTWGQHEDNVDNSILFEDL